MADVNIIISDDCSQHTEDEQDNVNKCNSPCYTDEDDADDEEEDVYGRDADDDDSSISTGRNSCDKTRSSMQPLDLEGSIVIGGGIGRRTSVCSCSSHSSSGSRRSCGSSTSNSSSRSSRSHSSSGSVSSGLSCDARSEHEVCTSCRSSRRGYTPTKDDSSQPEDDSDLLYPGFRHTTLFYLEQTTHPRDWCLKLVTNPYPFNIFYILP